ncbi:MAG: complex I subunit 5 family protein [Christensenellales bacterium]|jgi:formate hydrogenlyase subunit 3/multisubunit Na+/H+ antiporter MnhD subunit
MQAMILLPVFLPVFLPMLLAPFAARLEKQRPDQGMKLTLIGVTITLALCLGLFISATLKHNVTFGFTNLLFVGLSFEADFFRSLYSVVASFMWLISLMMVPEYMPNKRPRYLFFSLMTLGATLGLFLANDLVTCFIFFEIMSFTSYPWVAQEETPEAMRASQTYLAIAVFGGMCILFGLWLLYPLAGGYNYAHLKSVLSAQKPSASLYIASALMALGFGAKAGMFPVHIWLPKAHPVAPAPASALLSGVLTKAGIWGILVVATRLLPGNLPFSNVLLVIGTITMFLGALLALFSIDLKRTLACSSMSQIGFIIVGAAIHSLLGEHNAIPASGIVLHMLNHSLIKLTLFLAAGAVYMGLHKLNLNDVRGFGRKKPFLHLCFLVGAASISGIPGFSGYISKTLLHESIIEYIVELQAHGQGAGLYQVVEWIFTISGGFTFAYMLKLYICLFWEKPSATVLAAPQTDLQPLSRIALTIAAAVLFVFGLFPHQIMEKAGMLSSPFLQSQAMHPVAYSAFVNLKGQFISLAIGLLLYLLIVRTFLSKKEEDGRIYLNRWPEHIDLEDGFYRPGIQKLAKGLGKVAQAVSLEKN